MSVLIPALFGLLGVVIGGIITAGSNYLLDRRRERAINQRDSRNQAIEITRAARLINVELIRAQSATDLAIKTKHWMVPGAELKTEAWRDYGFVLVPMLSYHDWISVIKAVLVTDDMGLSRTVGPISDATAESLIPALKDIEDGIQALEPLAQGAPVGAE